MKTLDVTLAATPSMADLARYAHDGYEKLYVSADQEREIFEMLASFAMTPTDAKQAAGAWRGIEIQVAAQYR